MGIKLRKLSQENIQEAINLESLHHSPKTVRNIHGLISAVLGQYRPDMRLTTVLPKKVRPDLYIPSDGEIQRLMEYVTGDGNGTSCAVGSVWPHAPRGNCSADHGQHIREPGACVPEYGT